MFNPHHQEDTPQTIYLKNHKKNDHQDNLTSHKKFQGNKFFQSPNQNLGPNINFKTSPNDETDPNKLKKPTICPYEIPPPTNDKITPNIKNSQKNKIKNQIIPKTQQKQNKTNPKSSQQSHNKNKQYQFSQDDQQSLTQAILQCQKISQEQSLKTQQKQQKQQPQNLTNSQQKIQKQQTPKTSNNIIIQTQIIPNPQTNTQTLQITLKLTIKQTNSTSHKIYQQIIPSNNIQPNLQLLFQNIQQIKSHIDHQSFNLKFTPSSPQIEFLQIKHPFQNHQNCSLTASLYLKQQHTNNFTENHKNNHKIINSKSCQHLSMPYQNLIDSSQNEKYPKNNQQIIQQAKNSFQNQKNTQKLQKKLNQFQHELQNIKNLQKQQKQKTKQILQNYFIQKQKQFKIIQQKQNTQNQLKFQQISKQSQTILKKITDLEISINSRLKQSQSKTTDKFITHSKKITTLQNHQNQIKKWTQDVQTYLTTDLKNQIHQIYHEFSKIKSSNKNHSQQQKLYNFYQNQKIKSNYQEIQKDYYQYNNQINNIDNVLIKDQKILQGKNFINSKKNAQNQSYTFKNTFKNQQKQSKTQFNKSFSQEQQQQEKNLFSLNHSQKSKFVWHLFPSMTLQHPQTNLPVMVVKNQQTFEIDGNKITYYNEKNDWGQMKGGLISYQNPRNDFTVEFKVLKTKYLNSNFGIGIVNNIPPSQQGTKVYAQYPDVDKYYFQHAIIFNTGNCQLWKIQRTNKQILVTKGTGLKIGDIMRMIVNLEKGQIIWIVNNTQVGRINHKILINPHYQWNRFLLMKNHQDSIEIL